MSETVEKAKEEITNIDPFDLPDERTHVVIIAGPGIETEQLSDPLPKYQAMYLRDKLTGSVGHIGVSFNIKEV
jgi:hypothetical protein